MKQFHNKYLKVPLLFSGGGGDVPEWRRHLQPCEWLQTDGNSYIVLNYKINTITEIEGKFSQIYEQGKNTSVIGGGSTNGTLQIGVNNQKYIFFRCWSNTLNSISTIDVETNENIIFKITQSPKQITINNTNFSFTNAIVNVNYNLYLFASYFQDANPQLYINKCGLKIKKLYSNVFNLFAAYVIDKYTDNKNNLCSAGVPGMVDINTGIFFTNDGSGQFSHGEPIEIEI